MTWAVWTLVWVVCAACAALIADRKGRSVGGFALAGLVLGPIGLLWSAFAKPVGALTRRQAQYRRRQRLSQPVAASGDWRRHLP